MIDSVRRKHTREHSFLNTLRPIQNGRHFAHDIFRCVFLNVFWFTFHWNVFLRVHCQYAIIGSDSLAPNGRQAIIWTNGGIVYYRIHASIYLYHLMAPSVKLNYTQMLMSRNNTRLTCQRVSVNMYLYVCICLTFVIMHYCMICIARAITIVQLETTLVTTTKPIVLISMYISKLNLCSFHHMTCDLSQLFPGPLLMMASTTAVHWCTDD